MTGQGFDHEHAAGLLPWLANGTLEGDELEQVERHVRQCLACRAELAEQRRLRTLVQRQPAVHLSADAGFERLRSQLDRETRPRFAVRGRIGWALAATAAVAAVGWAITIGISGGGPPQSAADYQTLSRPPVDGARIDVIFAEGTREAEMRELLEELGAEIVAGPSRGLGRYTLRLPATGAEPGVDAVVRRLLGDPRVRFAGPSFSAQPEPSGRESASPLSVGASAPHARPAASSEDTR